jgi:hypothetical protein
MGLQSHAHSYPTRFLMHQSFFDSITGKTKDYKKRFKWMLDSYKISMSHCSRKKPRHKIEDFKKGKVQELCSDLHMRSSTSYAIKY